MADISRITLPNGGSYDLKDAVRGIEYIVGTQTAATGSWTGITTRAALFDGMMIRYYLPYAGSGDASLNLTLSGGGTTGDKPIYFNNKTRVTTQFPANSVIDLTYSTKIESTGAWCAEAQYNTNTYTTALSTTAGDVAAKVATCANYSLTANTYLHVIFNATNTVAGAITLNVNGKGAKPIYINGAASSASNYTLPAGSYIAFYNGTNWHFRTDGYLPTGGIVVQNTASILPSVDGSGNLGTLSNRWQRVIAQWAQLKPLSGEGGQIDLLAPDDEPTGAGITIDRFDNHLRIFGNPSADGETYTGNGKFINIYPYAGYITTQSEIRTSFKNAVAVGSYQATATTIPNLVDEVRYSNGCMGSFNLGTAYTLNSITLPTGWYNFEWIPHRTGGFNGAANGDNTKYGTLLLTPITAAAACGLYSIKYSNGSISTLYSFKHPTGDAAAGDVLSGKTFSNASGTDLTGTMANNGALSKTFTPSTSTQTYTIPGGYTSGGTVTCSAVSAKKTLGSTNGTNIDMGGAYRYVDTTAIANATRVDATLASAGNLWTGYTAYGKDGVKYTGTMNYVAAGTKHTFTPSASAQSYTIGAGYHRGSDTYVKCNAINNTGTTTPAGIDFRNLNGTAPSMTIDMGATNLYRYIAPVNLYQRGVTAAYVSTIHHSHFSMYAGGNHQTKTCTLKNYNISYRVIVMGAMRCATGSVLLTYQMKQGSTVKMTVTQTSSTVATGYGYFEFDMGRNATVTVSMVETAGTTGSGAAYYRAAWMDIVAIPTLASDLNTYDNVTSLVLNCTFT